MTSQHKHLRALVASQVAKTKATQGGVKRPTPASAAAAGSKAAGSSLSTDGSTTTGSGTPEEQLARVRERLRRELPEVQLPRLQREAERLRQRLARGGFGRHEVNSYRELRDRLAALDRQIEAIRSGRAAQAIDQLLERIHRPGAPPVPAAPLAHAAMPGASGHKRRKLANPAEVSEDEDDDAAAEDHDEDDLPVVVGAQDMDVDSERDDTDAAPSSALAASSSTSLVGRPSPFSSGAFASPASVAQLMASGALKRALAPVAPITLLLPPGERESLRARADRARFATRAGASAGVGERTTREARSDEDGDIVMGPAEQAALSELVRDLIDPTLLAPRKAEKDICSCGTPFVYKDGDAQRYCGQCGKSSGIVDVLDLSANSNAPPVSTTASATSTARNAQMAHFDEHVERFALESYILVPDEIEELLRTQAYMAGATSLAHQQVKELLKANPRFAAWAQHTSQICAEINADPAPHLGEPLRTLARDDCSDILKDWSDEQYATYSWLFVRILARRGRPEFEHYESVPRYGKRLAQLRESWHYYRSRRGWPVDSSCPLPGR